MKRRPIPGGVFIWGDGASAVIASPAKQSRLSPRRDSGLLRCARNDEERVPLLHLRQRGEDTGPGADAFLEAAQIVLLVRRVDVVVIEAKADQQRVEPERTLEIGDDRDRGA